MATTALDLTQPDPTGDTLELRQLVQEIRHYSTDPLGLAHWRPSRRFKRNALLACLISPLLGFGLGSTVLAQPDPPSAEAPLVAFPDDLPGTTSTTQHPTSTAVEEDPGSSVPGTTVADTGEEVSTPSSAPAGTAGPQAGATPPPTTAPEQAPTTDLPAPPTTQAPTPTTERPPPTNSPVTTWTVPPTPVPGG